MRKLNKEYKKYNIVMIKIKPFEKLMCVSYVLCVFVFVPDNVPR